jgi:hypothetical protein
MSKNRGFDNAQARWPWTHPNRYCSCGVQSLHHALLLLGKTSDLRVLLSEFPLLNNIGLGHELKRLVAAARSFGARPQNLTNSRLRPLRSDINRTLKCGSPVILGSDLNVHWLVLAGLDGDGGYVWIDSADDPLCGTWDWDGIVDWLGTDEETFEAIAIHPGKNDDPRRSMVAHIEGLHDLLGNDEELAGQWGDYLDDLDAVFNFKTTRGRRLDAETFFAENEEAIVQPVLWMEEDSLDEAVVRDVYANYRTVANFHSVELPRCFESHAVAHMAMMLRDSVT